MIETRARCRLSFQRNNDYFVTDWQQNNFNISTQLTTVHIKHRFTATSANKLLSFRILRHFTCVLGVCNIKHNSVTICSHKNLAFWTSSTLFHLYLKFLKLSSKWNLQILRFLSGWQNTDIILVILQWQLLAHEATKFLHRSRWMLNIVNRKHNEHNSTVINKFNCYGCTLMHSHCNFCAFSKF